MKSTISFMVYLTVNNVNRKIYIGVHRHIGNKFDGYIGCGIDGETSFHIKNPTTPFQRAVKKYGYGSFTRTTIANFETAEEAYTLEQTLVNAAFLRRSDVYNASMGGRGRLELSKDKAVFQYTLDGAYVRFWDFMADADRELSGVSSVRRISAAIGHGSGIAYGYQWRVFDVETYPKKIEAVDASKTRVVQYSLKGEFVRMFNSSNAAAIELGCKGAPIKKQAKRGKPYLGYQWKLVTGDDIPDNIAPYISPNIVLQIDNDNVVIAEFSSVVEARRATGVTNIKGVLAGNRKTAGNYKWKRKVEFI